VCSSDLSIPHDESVARRLLERAIAAARAPYGSVTAGAFPRQALVVSADGRWYRLPDAAAQVEVAGHAPARALLVALARQRVACPGRALSVAALVAAAWPDERVVARAGANRVYVGINRLRALGLRGLLRKSADGYLLSPDVDLVIAT
jgi:hypothetical protein